MNRYYKHIKPYWIFFVLSPIMMLIEVYCDVKLPYISAEIINVGVANEDTGYILYLTFKMLAYLSIGICGGVGASYCATKASLNFSCDLRAEIYEKIQTFSFKNIDRFSTGSLVTRLTNDITQLQQFVVMCLRMAFRAPGILIGAIFMAYTISPNLSAVFLVLVPILAVIITIVIVFSYKRFGFLQDKIDALNTNVQEFLTNIRVIKAFTREDFEYDKFDYVNADLQNTSISAYNITILQLPLMTMIVNFATIAIIYLGSKALHLDQLEIGDISALITYLTQILASVNMIAMVFLQSSRAIVSSARINEVLDTKADIENKIDMNLNKTVDSGSVTFKNVNFKYYLNNKELVLSNINLHIESGETVGIIGSTGCGKTSLINLIPRLYDTVSGSVLVDGVDVKKYDLKNLRDGVAVVLQNNMLFSGSVLENLRWGKTDASLEEVKEISTYSCANDFIVEKENGYNSEVEQGGSNFSGGQKQRLCIARALLKKPKIIILDDSTSALDTSTEAIINSYFKNELKEMTKIVIAQRISSIAPADKIIVMNDGTIEAIGNHDTLLKTCITYQEIYKSQMGKEVLEHE